ncbi:MAG TPA: protein YgfX [Burkholderiales bacterium]|nr:protein YgfX [Burkholderiales bacterium]
MVRIELRPSPRLAAVLVAAHLFAAAALAPLDLPWWFKLAGALVVCASLVRSLRCHALLRSRAAIMQVDLREGDRAAVRMRGGDWLKARVLGTTYVTPVVTILNVRLPGRRSARHVVLLSDSADEDTLRRARVALRWGYRNDPADASRA